MIERNDSHFSASNIGRGLVLAAIVVFGYFIPNKYILFPTHTVFLTRIDQWVALQPTWIWFYVAYYPLLISAWFVTTGTVLQRVYFSSMALATGVGFFVFFFFPTMISRDLYPLAGTMDASTQMLAHIRGADIPVNCLPSMHVCGSFIAATCISPFTSRNWRILIWGLFAAICYSTLATKQHYFVDLVAGFCLGLTSVALIMYRHQLLPELPELMSERDRRRS